jgi:hypothetical protein
MDFGKEPFEELKNLKLSLCPDPNWNKRVLSGQKAEHPKVYVVG